MNGGTVGLVVFKSITVLAVSISGCSFTGGSITGVIGSGGALYVGCPNAYYAPCGLSGAVTVTDTVFDTNAASSKFVNFS